MTRERPALPAVRSGHLWACLTRTQHHERGRYRFWIADEQPPHPGWYKATDGNWYPPLPQTNSHAAGSLIAAVIALLLSVLWLTSWFGLILGAVSVVTGFYARLNPVGRGQATAAIIIGALAVLLAIGNIRSL